MSRRTSAYLPTVPSITAGRVDAWSVFRDGSVYVHSDAGNARTTMPLDLAARVVGDGVFPARRVRVRWQHPTPELSTLRVNAAGHPVVVLLSVELSDELLGWYARLLGVDGFRAAGARRG